MNWRGLLAVVFQGPEAEGLAPSSDGLTPEQERRAGAIARQTMSPFCPGRTLADCPSTYAAEWRTDIREMVRQGKSADEIQRELEGRIGSNLSGSPNRGVSYGVSLVFGALALGVLGAVFVRLRAGRAVVPSADSSNGGRKATHPSTAPAAVDDARLEAELQAEGGELDD